MYVDVWQPGTYTVEIMQAYAELSAEGSIKICAVEISRKHERVTIHYTAEMTIEHAHEMIKVRHNENKRLEAVSL